MFYRILAFVLLVVFATIAFMAVTSATAPLISEPNSLAVLLGFVLLFAEVASFAAFLYYTYHRMFHSFLNPSPTPKE